LAETLMLIRRRIPADVAQLEAKLDLIDIQYIPATVEHARIAASARGRFPLNIGDCFVYALSVTAACPILTLDRDFRACDRPVQMPHQLSQ
jgi:uncharacterized protein with PIN domain